MSDQILPRDNEGLLQIENLSKYFKGLRAIYNYHLRLRQGEILGIIGPNGAGKSTLFNLITGYIRPSSGKIRFCGQDITNYPPDKIVKLGIGRTFQSVRLFSSMTLMDNVRTAQQLHRLRQSFHYTGFITFFPAARAAPDTQIDGINVVV